MDIIFKFISCCQQWRERSEVAWYDSWVTDYFEEWLIYITYNILQKHVAVFIYNTNIKQQKNL